MIKNLYELYNLIEKVSTALPNVNQFVNSFDSLNREDTSYAAVVLQFRDGTQATEGTVRYRFYLGYVDRVNENTDTPSTSNNILTQSIAEENIRLIINKLYPEVDITFGNTFYPFTQRFTALTAGCYVELAITLAVKDCNYESGSVLRDVEIVSDSNGVKEVVPGAGVDGFKKVIVRTEVPLKTEIEKDIVITANGNTTYTPDEGQSFSKVNVDVNVPIKTEVAKDIVINENGNTTYTPNEGEVFNSVSVDVNVPSIDDVIPYFYKKPTVDDAGLKSLGWTDDDVKYLKYNNYAYPWEADNYKVSDANKQITINSLSDIATYASNPDFQYCPMFDIGVVTDIDQAFNRCKYIIAIPLLDTRSITNMNVMFRECASLTTIPPLNTSNVNSMIGMFEFCYSLNSIPQMDTSKVENMREMFYTCRALTTIPQLDTSKVTDMDNMFGFCQAVTSLPLLNVSNVTSMSSMFRNCYSLMNLAGFTGLKTNLDLSPCSNLTKESLLNVFNEAADVTASPKTLTLGSTNLNKLTAEEKAIATNKGWTLA